MAQEYQVWVSPPSDQWKLGTVVQVRKSDAEGQTVGYFKVIGFHEDGAARLTFSIERPDRLN